MPLDIKGFLERKHMKGVELQKKLGLSSGMLSIYKSGNSNPSYKVLCDLIEEGITLDEMFGKELAEKLRQNGDEKTVFVSERPNAETTDAEFDYRLKSSLKRLLGGFDIK